MKKLTKITLVVLALTAYMILPSVITTPTEPVKASEKEIIQSDPYRPTFDTWGNQWSYDGKLINAQCPNVPDPISHKDNPQCKPVKKPVPKPTNNKSVQCDA